jgi:hypothetical protein
MTENKKLFKIIIGVIAGVVAGAIVFFLLIEIFFYLGLYGWADIGDPAYLRKLDQTTNATIIITILSSLIIAFIISRIIIKSGNKTNSTID